MYPELRFVGSLKEFRKWLAGLVVEEAKLRSHIALAKFYSR